MFIKKAKQLPNIYIAGISCIVFYILGMIEFPSFEDLGMYWVSTIFLSLSIFILFINIIQVKDNIFSKIGREDSLYIYLLHLFIAIGITQLSNKYIYLPYFSTLITLSLTLFLIYILRKLKIIGKVI